MTSLTELENYMAGKGCRLTRNRRIILQVLLEQADWCSARELYSCVLARAHKVDFSTIYRNLDSLTALGLLCQVERADAVQYYILNQVSGHHHHHLICKSCHKITQLDFCPLSLMDNDTLQNFAEVECKFDIYGFCRECQAKNEHPPGAGRDES